MFNKAVQGPHGYNRGFHESLTSTRTVAAAKIRGRIRPVDVHRPDLYRGRAQPSRRNQWRIAGRGTLFDLYRCAQQCRGGSDFGPRRIVCFIPADRDHQFSTTLTPRCSSALHQASSRQSLDAFSFFHNSLPVSRDSFFGGA